jgi:small-conductance mechanosensitive channel
VEEIQTRATIIKTYDGRRVVIPNADLFTHSVIVNTALDTRRWEYALVVKDIRDFAAVKSVIASAVSKVPGVLPDPAPEALVIELDPDPTIAKVRVLWSTNASREREMLASYDKVLVAIRESLNRFMDEEKNRTIRKQAGSERAA